MGLYSGGLIIGRIFASGIWGSYFREGLFLGELIIGILQYLGLTTECFCNNSYCASKSKTTVLIFVEHDPTHRQINDRFVRFGGTAEWTGCWTGCFIIPWQCMTRTCHRMPGRLVH